jgi:hypothetical protein
MASDVRSYAVAFLLTLVLEVGAALMLGFRQRSEIASVICVNVFSHPLLVYVIWLVASLRSIPLGLAEVSVLEAIVVLLEWRLLCFALPRQRVSRLLVLSLMMNSLSFLTGLFLAGSFGSI